ncbi:MAG: hypothetical protein EOO46_19990, partial [Flavobacterium sp.]
MNIQDPPFYTQNLYPFGYSQDAPSNPQSNPATNSLIASSTPLSPFTLLPLSSFLTALPRPSSSPSIVSLNFQTLGNGIIYSMLRFNFNKRFADPSLTIPQMLLSIGLVLYLQIYAGQARGGYLLALMLAFAFGCFKLKTAQLLWLTFLTVAIYVCTIPIIMQIEGSRFNPAVELALGLVPGAGANLLAPRRLDRG